MTAIKIPGPFEPELDGLARVISERLAREGTAVAKSDVYVVLSMLRELGESPRYEVVPVTKPGAVAINYIVRDNHTGRAVETYYGYFAGQDARWMARRLNSEDDES